LTLLALLQDVVLTNVTLLGGHPDIVFLVVAVWAFLRGTIEGSVWAFIGGVILDLCSGGPFGGMTLALLAVAFILGQQWGQELGSTVLQLILLILIACFTYHVILLLVLGWIGQSVNWAYALPQVAAPSAILNAVLAPFVHWPLQWLNRRTRPEGFTLDQL
jgi:rod shape-determining protein MreD